MKMKSTCAIALSFGMAAAANAAVIIGTTSTTSVGTQNPDGATLVLGAITTVTDGSGLSAALTTANIGTVTHAGFNTGSNSWVTSDPNGNTDFFTVAGAQGTVIIEIVFDDSYTVDTMSTWGYGWNADQGNNSSAITVDYGVGDFASTAGSITMPLTTLGASSTVGLGGITADRVRLTVTDNHFGASGGGDRVGFAELAFVGTAAVPEPSSAALLGLGGIALILRRRK